MSQDQINSDTLAKQTLVIILEPILTKFKLVGGKANVLLCCQLYIATNVIHLFEHCLYCNSLYS